MHVLVIPSWYPQHSGDIGGSFFREQALALNKHGCKVGVIYPQLRSLRNWKSVFTVKRGISVEDDSGVMTYRSHGMNWFPRLVNPAFKLFLLHGRRLYEKYVFENGVPDVVHAHSLLNAGLLAYNINKKHGVPYVVTEHSSGFARKIYSRQQLRVAGEASISAKRRFAVSSEFASLLNQIIGAGAARWEALPNIVSESFINYRLPINADENKFKFINVALMDKNKAQQNIIYAFEKLKKTQDNIFLTLVGDGPEKKKLEKLTVDLDVHDSVKFAGLLSRDEVLKAMAESDAFVLSSRYETFGVVIIEALALGKPVIATRCGGPESIVRENDGILVPVDDVNALCNAMNQLIATWNSYDPIEIRQACIDRYGEASIAKKLIKIYSESILK